MEGKMKTAVMTGLRKIAFEERDIPVPRADEVLVKIEYVGVCGSDLHFYEAGHIGNCKVEFPFVLGHEAAGTVVEAGADVKHLKKGDHVALEPGKTCGTCGFRRTGRYNLCSQVEFFATPPYDGVLQEYAAHKAELCFKLPDHVDTLEGAMIEPLAVGFHAARQGEAGPGQTAVIMGAGCIGLVTLMALKAYGVSEVYVVDVLDRRLQKARELGASEVINGKETDAVKRIMELTGQRGCDLAFEAAGTDVTARQAIDVVKKGATIVLVGYSSSGEMTLPMSQVLDKELRLQSVFRYRHIYPMAIQAVADKKADVKKIVTNLYGFDDVQRGLDECLDHKEDIVKAAIRIS